MNAATERFNVIHGIADTDAEVQHRKVRASRRFAACLAVFFVIALGTSAWLIQSTGVPVVSTAAATADARLTPQVPYFPSQYVNQATEVEPPIATF